ncbi:MAG TPA: VOC family protein [Ilumatobacteraceae bacterium]|nr:VOC family protein [Ilumatobacteraceae bacterium]
MIDHLVYASADLPTASARIADLLGVAPTPGGNHVGHGTYNELLSLGDTTYLEIIGPDPAQPEPAGGRPFGIDQLTAPALVAWCVRPLRPLREVVAAARAVGADFGDAAPMSRRRPDGVLLEWSLTFPQLDGPFGCALPFLIDWGESAHPTDSLPQGVRLLGLDITHPNPESLRPVLDVIGLANECTVHAGERPALSARIATSRGDVILSS